MPVKQRLLGADADAVSQPFLLIHEVSFQFYRSCES